MYRQKLMRKAEEQRKLAKASPDETTQNLHEMSARLWDELAENIAAERSAPLSGDNVRQLHSHAVQSEAAFLREQRSIIRRRSGVAARIRLEHGTDREANVLELSATGCRLFQESLSLEVNATIHIWFGELGPVQGRITWSVGRVSGVRFQCPLRAEIVESIACS